MHFRQAGLLGVFYLSGGDCQAVSCLLGGNPPVDSSGAVVQPSLLVNHVGKVVVLRVVQRRVEQVTA